MFRFIDSKIEDYDWANRTQIHNSELNDIYKVLNLKTGSFVAIKQYKLSRFSTTIKSELEAKKSAIELVSGECILKHFKTFCFPEFVYTVFELCDTSLQKLCLKKEKDLSVEEIRMIAGCIAKGAKSIEEGKCVHGNLHPRNILRKDGVWKLSNFTKLRNQRRKQHNKLYPENKLLKRFSMQRMLGQESKKEQQRTKSDVWIFGAILFQLAFGYLPAEKSEQQDLTSSLTSTHTLFLNSKSTQVDQSLLDLIQGCLKQSSKQRLSWFDIFNHPFITLFIINQKIIIKQRTYEESNIYLIISNLQHAAIKTLGSSQNLYRFCSGKASWNGIKMTCNRKLTYDQFYNLCQRLNPQINQIELKMLSNWVDTSSDGYIDQSQFARLVTSSTGTILYNFFKQLATILKNKNINPEQILSKYDYDQSDSLEAKQLREISKSLLPNLPNSDLSIIIDFINKRYNGKLPIKVLLEELKSIDLIKRQEKCEESTISQELTSFRNQLKQYQITITKMVRNFDKNKNQKLDFNEFKKLVYSIDKFVREKELRMMFDEVDKDKSGHISVKELQWFFEGS